MEQNHKHESFLSGFVSDRYSVYWKIPGPFSFNNLFALRKWKEEDGTVLFVLCGDLSKNPSDIQS